MKNVYLRQVLSVSKITWENEEIQGYIFSRIIILVQPLR